jgi:hypothetical protein
MRASSSRPLVAAALSAALAIFAAGTVTFGAIASAGSAEARTLNSSQPRRAVRQERKIPLEVLRREGVPEKLRLREIGPR